MIEQLNTRCSLKIAPPKLIASNATLF